MSLLAQVVAIGPFSEAVAPALEYSADRYAGVPGGAEVVTNIFTGLGSRDSYRLANAFGVSAWDLGRHRLNPEKADLACLRELFDEEEVTKFLLLHSSGFAFYYLPNG